MKDRSSKRLATLQVELNKQRAGTPRQQRVLAKMLEHLSDYPFNTRKPLFCWLWANHALVTDMRQRWDRVMAGTLASAGTNFGAAPTAAASMVAGLQAAGSDLMNTIGQAGANLESISGAAPAGSLFSDAASLQAAMANAGALSAAVQGGAYINRAALNTSLAAGIALGGPLVRS